MEQIVKERTITGEPWFLTSKDPDISSQDEGGNKWVKIFYYQVPRGHEIVFRPDDTFGCYLFYTAEQLDAALADDGGSITDESAEAAEATGGDMTLMPATEALNDAYYFGWRFPFSNLRIDMTQAGTGGDADALAWEYYNGSDWVDVPEITDNSSYLSAGTDTYNVEIRPPGDWAAVSVDGRKLFWVRARCKAADYSVQPTAGQAWIGYHEMHDDDLVRIEVRSPNEWESTKILEERYGQLKEITHRDSKYPLALRNDFLARGGEWVVVSVKSTGIVDVSASYFVLECLRARPTIYGS